MGADAPQWLYSSFATAMQDIGATASDEQLRAEARDLVGRWQDPDRQVHGLRHLINVLARIDELSTTVHDPDILRVAAWYHGLVLNRAVSILLEGASTQDVAGSCQRIATHRLEELGVSEDVVARVAELILSMARRSAPRDDVDAQVLVDADLASLAASPQDYKKYRLSLRDEYPHLGDLDFLRARRRVVRRLLSRPSIFQSPMGAQWEGRARENLEAELARIDERIHKLDPTDPTENDAALEADIAVEDGSAPSGDSLTSTGTLIIRRRKLHKNRRPGNETDMSATGTIPIMRPEPADAPDDAEDVDSSSLETAIDVLDAQPAVPAAAPAPAPVDVPEPEPAPAPAAPAPPAPDRTTASPAPVERVSILESNESSDLETPPTEEIPEQQAPAVPEDSSQL